MKGSKMLEAVVGIDLEDQIKHVEETLGMNEARATKYVLSVIAGENAFDVFTKQGAPRIYAAAMDMPNTQKTKRIILDQEDVFDYLPREYRELWD